MRIAHRELSSQDDEQGAGDRQAEEERGAWTRLKVLPPCGATVARPSRRYHAAMTPAEAASVPTRDDAWQLLCEWTQSESLRKHGLAVEAATAWYGEHRFGVTGGELEQWRVAGLLHDFDYERYPATHPVQGAEELRRMGYPAGGGRGRARPRRPHWACRAPASWPGPSTPATR